MPDGNKKFCGSLVLGFGIWQHHIKMIYSPSPSSSANKCTNILNFALSLQLSISMKFYTDLQKYGADEVT